MSRTNVTLLTSLLGALGVPHTAYYSDARFRTMPFNSLFGLTRLLRDYNVDSEGLVLGDRSQLQHLDCPFLAQTDSSFVVVTRVKASSVEYIDDTGEPHTDSLDAFMKLWTGVVLLVYTCDGSCEPHVGTHRVTETGRRVMRWLFVASAAFLIIFAIVAGRSYASFSTMAAIILAMAGCFVSYLLLLKQMGVKSKTADSVCAVVQAGGCDHVLATGASKFFGLFGWSEIGAAYFGITLTVLLVAPHYQPWIAMLNVFCLPFSFWSVWYQRFRAHAWCTLCLTVQGLLWLLFFVQLPSAWWHTVSFFSWPTFVIGALYLFALLAINRIMTRLAPPTVEPEQ